MKYFYFILFAVITFFYNTNFIYAQNSNVNLIILGCNNDTFCEAAIGEDLLSCPLDCTPPPEPTSTPDEENPRRSSRRDPSLLSISINQENKNALVNWTSNVPVLATISWGKTPDYELGTISEISYTKDHLTRIPEIDYGSNYFIRIFARNGNDKTFDYQGSFQTSIGPDQTSPQNVLKLRAEKHPVGALLQWENPPDLDFSYVRVIRNEFGYPRNSEDGQVLYEGGGQSFLDENVIIGGVYYYTVYTRDTTGNLSSGVAIGFRVMQDEVSPLDSKTGSIVSEVGPIFSTTNAVIPRHISLINFIQEEKNIPVIESTVYIRPDLPITVEIPASLVTIGKKAEMRIYVYENEYEGIPLVYLFRPDASSSNYYSEISGFTTEGRFKFKIHIAEINKIYEYEGFFDVQKGQNITQKSSIFAGFWGGVSGQDLEFKFLGTLFLITLILGLIFHNRMK